jgi:subtilisin family serine protease
MAGDHTGGLPELVYAQVSPRSVGGVSMFEAATITQDTAAGYVSEPELASRTAAQLSAAGFQVLQVAPQTVNVAAPPGLYEAFFQTRLLAEERPVLKPGQLESTATFVECPETGLPGLIDASHSPVASLVEGVAIERPVYAHELPLPPRVRYWHLNVPGDLTLALNADRAHRAGLTGRGVRLAMIDSGWYRHPYFEARGYRAAVVLGPGAADPASDEQGHGTGESANALALAPDVDFTMVKMSPVNSIGAFGAAAQLDPPPQVISCSWGSDVRDGPLGAADQALAAAIALAVAGGTVVVCSAGNGHFSFPGQHPDVVSAGGVFVERDGRLRASDYASGFESKVYPGRKVPDVSGAVGMLPHAAFLMLPVQPGCHIDRELGGSGYPRHDRTGVEDGWAAFSGTSAAAPQVAGVCALVRQAHPALSPDAIRDLLGRTARDVARGSNHPRMGAHAAGNGYDLATGHGLVDAWSAVRAARGSGPGAVARQGE